MKRATLLAVIFGIVVVVAVGILLAVLLSGDKPSVLDDDFDLALGGTEAPPEETQAPPPEETQAPPEETQAPPPEETQAPPEETQAPPPNKDPAAIIGLWSGNISGTPVACLPESYAQRAFELNPKDKAALVALIEDLLKDSSITENVYFHVYREDGTGYYVGTRGASAYGYSTYDYFNDGDVLFTTNYIGTVVDEDPDWSYSDEKFDDEDEEYRIFVADGQEKLLILPNFGEASMYYGLTMDEFMETDFAKSLTYIRLK